MSGALNAGIPNSPMVDPATGLIMPEWRAFLQRLWVRTGGAPGQSTDTAELQGALADETAARIAGDNALGEGLTNEAAARTAGDAANAAAISHEADVRGAADYNEAVSRVQGDTAAHWATLNLSGLPTTNPGGGLPWLSGGNIHVGP